ncbi:MAG: hypothetical protein OEM96_06060, partial [Gemmatimonadota bacterium]|nr:hypothetical protein [Gemmatimonadota bacterium]
MRPAERTVAAGAFFTLFGFTTGHALLETARDALFLGRLPASRLPWVYLAIAVIALLAAEYQGRLLKRWSSRNELSVWLVAASLVTGALWVALHSPLTWSVYALYVWTGVLATLVVVRFWTLLGMLFTATQAKRIYAFVGVGSVLGSILGSALARLLTGWFSASTLVLVAAIVFLLNAPAPRLLDHRRMGRLPRVHGIGSARQLTKVALLIWSRPYLRRVGSLIIASTITFTLVDFVFKTAVDRSIPPDQLGEFFATFYLGLNVLSLLVQVAGVSWLIRRLGVNRAVAIVPALLVVGSLGVSFGGTLVFALLLKGADGGLRHSLFRTGAELFWVPIPLELRVRVKPVIDTLGQRGGQAIASLAILA